MQIFNFSTGKGVTINVGTRQCLLCRETSVIKVDKAAYDQWANGMFVQDAFPHIRTDRRELLITGTHPECFKKLFPEDEEDE